MNGEEENQVLFRIDLTNFYQRRDVFEADLAILSAISFISSALYLVLECRVTINNCNKVVRGLS